MIKRNISKNTKIVCTIGPASDSEEMIKELMLAGMNCARFNFSHGSHEEHKARFDKVIAARRELDLPVATLLDTKGPEIRLRDFENGSIELKEGQHFTLTTDENVVGNENIVSVTFKEMTDDVIPGSTILIDLKQIIRNHRHAKFFSIHTYTMIHFNRQHIPFLTCFWNLFAFNQNHAIINCVTKENSCERLGNNTINTININGFCCHLPA